MADSAGKFPNWSDALVFRKQHEDTLSVAVWDRDNASTDDLVGETTVPMSRVLTGSAFEDWLEITY